MFATQDQNDQLSGLQPDVQWADARCRDGAASMLNMFFSEQLDDIRRAKAICQTCPIMDACLDGAVSRREPWGVWVASSLPTGGSSPRSAGGDARPRTRCWPHS